MADTLLVLMFLALCVGYLEGFQLPRSIRERLSPLDDASALHIKQELQASSRISHESCKAAGLLCGDEHHSLRQLFHHHHDHHDRSAMESSTRDLAQRTFFQLKTLVGAKNIQLPPPLRWDNSIPVSKFLHPLLEPVLASMNLSQLLSTMHFSSQSPFAATSKDSLEMCSSHGGIKHEIKACHVSAKSILDQASSTLHKLELKYVANTLEFDPNEPFQVVETRVVAADGSLACHPMTFPFAIFMCHTIPNSLVLEVDLLRSSSKKTKPAMVKVPAVCHMDTSDFAPSHISFKILNTRPGEGEVCHWLPTSHLVWY
ncbi:BURP domain-containing protein BNM2C-like [Selaginella moellendorffii]|uniref:BURP domain-containing protein BNM2C-like n=1 Tax=Selaginella moellendorffii TaxID=88036 RepID=UPI000D1CD780|nr:BURP domain-containing protein BNM2C-like [Selaginella moellendorffii]XP_024534417.1 BURP domain-containing protein BNM2C-like [Selaginella moellendorffii]|eukprot:XP_024534238.1 BURP domain-containing protein BNM2C-like [Selaginella moellendorffii]